ncbi:exopolysaccharide biosynthesis protein [Variovorax sp. VNK109]|uniref:exopolysaccharide biosynthesis protein n=1 Tax=Variovorax sp. VNK109 TaxID=3400919 RepID=UPI003C0399D3
MDLLAHSEPRVSIGDIMESFGNRSFGPAIALPAMFELTPIGSIPGMPTLLAACIVFFAAQMAMGRTHMWVPQFLARRSLPSGKLKRAVQRLRPVALKADDLFNKRLSALTRPPFSRIVAFAVIALALAVPPLEIIPFATSIPMSVIVLTGLSLMLRDGVLLLVAIALLPISMTVWMAMS